MMKRTIRSEEQIIGILQEHETGAKCADFCRKQGMSEGTFYAWKARYSGMTVTEAKRPKPPKLNGLGPELLISTLVDAGTRNQLDLLLNT
jgi:putative transposase